MKNFSDKKFIKIIKESVNKTKYFTAAFAVFVIGIILLSGIMNGAKTKNVKDNVILLPTMTPTEALFKKPDEESVATSAKADEPKDEIKSEAAKEAPLKEVFLHEEKKEFKIEIDKSAEVINGFSKNKLVRSKTTGDWRTHCGIDIMAENGKEVFALADGTVEAVFYDKLMGQTVKITHENGYNSVYSNLSEKTNVNEGDTVNAGDVLGTAGNTAILEKDEKPHFHLEIIKDGENIDPLNIK